MKKMENLKVCFVYKANLALYTKPKKHARPTGHGGQIWLCYKAKFYYYFCKK